MGRPVFFFDVSLLLLVIFLSCLCLFHEFIHFSHKLLQLTGLMVFFLQTGGQIMVVFLHLLNESVSLLEFFLDNFQFLRVCKSIFWFDNFFELAPKSCAFLHVKLYFNFNFLHPRALDVAFECFDLCSLFLVFQLNFFDFAFKVQDQVSLSFQASTDALRLILLVLDWQAKILILVRHNIIYVLIAFL